MCPTARYMSGAKAAGLNRGKPTEVATMTRCRRIRYSHLPPPASPAGFSRLRLVSPAALAPGTGQAARSSHHPSDVPTPARHQPRHTKAAARAAALQSRLQPAFLVSPAALTPRHAPPPEIRRTSPRRRSPPPRKGSVVQGVVGNGSRMSRTGAASTRAWRIICPSPQRDRGQAPPGPRPSVDQRAGVRRVGFAERPGVDRAHPGA